MPIKKFNTEVFLVLRRERWCWFVVGSRVKWKVRGNDLISRLRKNMDRKIGTFICLSKGTFTYNSQPWQLAHQSEQDKMRSQLIAQCMPFSQRGIHFFDKNYCILTFHNNLRQNGVVLHNCNKNAFNGFQSFHHH